mmetsp:Transcript_58312/g.106277  ORF Transcript_58312/g.106277 Transcript_58312/m.106277 type:complete len:98 (-) Transcript_58312:51-344(-)
MAHVGLKMDHKASRLWKWMMHMSCKTLSVTPALPFWHRGVAIMCLRASDGPGAPRLGALYLIEVRLFQYNAVESEAQKSPRDQWTHKGLMSCAIHCS